MGEDIFAVPDATADPRFAGNPLVDDEPAIRFYAGAPLQTSDGHSLGTICVIDRDARSITARQVLALRALARLTVNLLEQRARR